MSSLVGLWTCKRTHATYHVRDGVYLMHLSPPRRTQLLMRSNLPFDVLGQLWNLADYDKVPAA